MLIVTIVCTIVLVALDQLTKMWAVGALHPVGTMPVLPGIIEFKYVENTGAAFSFFSGMQPFLIAVTSIALLVVAFILFVRRPKDKLELFALVFILAGGLGNLIDRVLNGYVVDFFNFLFINFAVFNVADICVCVGFALLVLAFIRMEMREREAKKIKDAQQTGQEPCDDAQN